MNIGLLPCSSPTGNQFTDNNNKLVNLFMTFDNFPEDVPVDTYLLAHSGFAYTGIEDRVKCSECGAVKENWQAGEDGNLAKWHQPGCKFGPQTRKNHYSQMPLASKTPNAGDILRSGMGGNFSPQLARARSKPRSIISTPTGDSFDDAPLPGSRRPRDTTDD